MTQPAPYYYFRRLSADGKFWQAPGRPDVPTGRTPTPNVGRVMSLWAVAPTGGGTVVTRDDLDGKYGTYRPVVIPGNPAASTAGLLATARTPAGTVGDTTNITTNGTASAPVQISNIEYHNRVNGGAQYVDFHNCDFRGASGGLNRNLVQFTGAGTKRIRFYDCRFWPQSPCWDSVGLKGWQVEVRRSEFLNCIDAFQHTSSLGYAGIDQGVVFEGNVFHKYAHFSPDPGAAGGLGDNQGHVDGLQIMGGSNFRIVGNDFQQFLDPAVGQGNLVAVVSTQGTQVTGNRYGNPTWPLLPTTSAMMFSPVLGALNGLWIENNWFDGGVYAMNFAGHVETAPNININNNVMGVHARGGRNALLIAQNTLPFASFGGNTHEDDGSPCDIRTRG